MTLNANLRILYCCKGITSQLLGKQKLRRQQFSDHNKNIKNINIFPYYSHFTAMMRRLKSRHMESQIITMHTTCDT